jgi:hypothetical protein
MPRTDAYFAAVAPTFQRLSEDVRVRSLSLSLSVVSVTVPSFPLLTYCHDLTSHDQARRSHIVGTHAAGEAAQRLLYQEIEQNVTALEKVRSSRYITCALV